MMDRVYPLNDSIHSHCTTLQISGAQQAQRIRLQRLGQQRSRMENLSDVISSSHKTIISLQKKMQMLTSQNKKLELLYLQSQRQNEQLREQNRIVSSELKHERNQKSNLISRNTELKQQLLRLQNQANLHSAGKQFRSIDISQAPLPIQDDFYNSLLHKFSRLQRKLAKKEKQNSILHSELQECNSSYQINKSHNNYIVNHSSTDLQKFRKSKYDKIKSQLRKHNTLKERQKPKQSYSKMTSGQHSEKQLKVCPCHYIGKSLKSKRKVNDSLY